MTKIFADTNRFLQIYGALDGGVDTFFDEYEKVKSQLVLTQQTITEFCVNRPIRLKALIGNRTKHMPPAEPPPGDSLSGYKKSSDPPNGGEEMDQALLQCLKQRLDDENGDRVLKRLQALAADKAVTVLKLTDRVVLRAFCRRLLRNPPGSPTQDMRIGDQVNWELLLEKLHEDLIVVTGDHTFKDNFSLLSEEYKRRTDGTLLRVVEHISEAEEAIGQKPSKELVEEEKKLPKYQWAKEGIHQHAAALWKRVNALIGDYAENVEMETGECISDDAHIIPIMGSLAALIQRQCDEVKTDIREDAGMDPGEET